jgi:hypothetical protein
VAGVDATSNAANVVREKAEWNRPVGQFEGKAVYGEEPATDFQSPVTVARLS